MILCVNINGGERNMEKIIVASAVAGAIVAATSWYMATGL
jgi:hypothetical protein